MPITPSIRALIITALSLSLHACDSRPKFTESEKAQARLFSEAFMLDNQATQISNSWQAYTLRKQEDIDRILALYSAALGKAEQIPNSVLIKIHKDLPENYAKYKKGMALKIDNLKNRNVASEITGSKLVDEYIDWFNSHRTELKVPK